MKAEGDNSAKSIVPRVMGFMQVLKKRVDEAQHLMADQPPKVSLRITIVHIE